MDQELSDDIIRSRGWWQGPEIFVLVDDINLTCRPGSPAHFST